MKKLFFALSAVLALALSFSESYAQNGRSFIRESIAKYGECKNVAITKYNGDLMLYGDNGWAASSCPEGLTDALSELNDDAEKINDVQLTEDGSWLILWGSNGATWSNIPYDLEAKIRHYNDEGEVITSITFNDGGDWICITEEHISASDSRVLDWMSDGMDEYGQVWAACVTDDAVVVVYEKGYKFMGNVPDSLKDALAETSLDVYRIKIAGSSWFFADKYGDYRYNM